MKINIVGDPIAKARHRSTRAGRMYNPQSKEEAAAIWFIQQQKPVNFEPFTCPLAVTVNAVFTRPKAHYGTGRNAGKLKPSAPKECVNPKDCDNILKFYTDAMNKIIYDDDRQCVSMTATKRWAVGAELPNVEIVVEEVK